MNKSEKEQIMENLRLQECYEQQLKESMALNRNLRYEMKDSLLHADELLREGKTEELRRYLDEKICLQDTITDRVDTGRPLISTLLNQKRAFASEMGIEMDIHAVLPGRVSLSDTDLITVLGSLLDNAMEECAGQKQGKIVLVMRPVKGYLLISVSNTVTDERKESGIGDTQDQLHGPDENAGNIRLKTVQYMADRYDGMISCKRKDENTFMAECLLGLPA